MDLLELQRRIAAVRDGTSAFAPVVMPIEVELGRSHMTVRRILDLAPGHTISLRRSAGENVDLVMGSTRIGSAEVIVIEDQMAVRITELDRRD